MACYESLTIKNKTKLILTFVITKSFQIQSSTSFAGSAATLLPHLWAGERQRTASEWGPQGGTVLVCTLALLTTLQTY